LQEGSSHEQTKTLTVLLLCACVLLDCGQALAVCTEPALADYTAYPVFQANAVEPNILIILDNSAA